MTLTKTYHFQVFRRVVTLIVKKRSYHSSQLSSSKLSVLWSDPVPYGCNRSERRFNLLRSHWSQPQQTGSLHSTLQRKMRSDERRRVIWTILYSPRGSVEKDRHTSHKGYSHVNSLYIRPLRADGCRWLICYRTTHRLRWHTDLLLLLTMISLRRTCIYRRTIGSVRCNSPGSGRGLICNVVRTDQ